MAEAQAAELMRRYVWGEPELWEVENVDGRGAPAAEKEGGAVMLNRDGRRKREMRGGQGETIAIHIGSYRRTIAFVPPHLIPAILRQICCRLEGRKAGYRTLQRVSPSPVVLTSSFHDAGGSERGVCVWLAAALRDGGACVLNGERRAGDGQHWRRGDEPEVYVYAEHRAADGARELLRRMRERRAV
ncbi:hypothetical protein B0H14DRAFT_2630822 [Mycena olivaceomarginata]|nr:hypothetical protein B0H14DRAFT_2630822 [Mycena olivaceomarginata]